MESVYGIRFIDYYDLNFVLIPTGDLGRNDSQEISIILRHEEESSDIFHKYNNGTIDLPTTSAVRVIDGTGTPWINISLTSFGVGPSERKVSIEVRTQRFRSKGYYFDKSVDETKWLQPTKYIDSDHEAIIAKSSEITSPGQSRKTKVTKIVNFVKSAIDFNKSLASSEHWIDNDTYYGEENGKASDVLRIKQGVCNHYARLCAALCRASDVPARLVIGYLISFDETWSSYDTGLHAWIEYYDLQMWHCVEPRAKILDIYTALYFPLICGPTQEDSFYVESRSPDMYVLDTKGDDDTHIYEFDSYIGHTVKEVMFAKDESLAIFLLIGISVSFIILIVILVKKENL